MHACSPPDDGFQPCLLPEVFELGGPAARAVVRDYEAILRTVMRFVAERFERDPAYGWCDTKYDILRGVDFPDEDPVRGRGTVYGWIQGRALEAMAGHAHHFAAQGDDDALDLAGRLRAAVSVISANLARVRRRNGGHLSFFFTPDGVPFVLSPAGDRLPLAQPSAPVTGYADLFAAKGLLAAAALAEDGAALRESEGFLRETGRAVLAGEFRNDQQPLNPRNPVPPPGPGQSQGPFMILLGAAALWLRHGGGREAADLGCGALSRMLDHHASLDDDRPPITRHDYWEFVGEDGLPLLREGRILSDPGHALEFVGLASEFAREGREQDCFGSGVPEPVSRFESAAPAILHRNFANGFNRGAGGICKSFDLVSRLPVSAEMPWWSLPEAMRAALLAASLAPSPEARRACLDVFRASHNAFVTGYVRPDRHCLAVQTRSPDGSPVDAIPATADADPGYHTGLCLISCLRELARA